MNARTFPLPVRALTVDLDGTMLDTIEDLAVAVNMTMRDLALRELALEQVRTFVGKGLANLVKRSLEASIGQAPDDAMMARALPVYERNYEEVNGRTTVMYPGVREGLDALAAAGFPMACVTNKSKRFTGPLLKRVGLDHYFSLVISGDTLAKKKPDPLPLLHCATHFGVDPTSLLMIGDSVNDAEAAFGAGCPVFCVSYGYNEGRDVRTLGVDAIVGSLADIPPLIRKV